VTGEDRRGTWICVDGVEGTGKTTIATHLAQALPVELAPEFSDSVFGHALRAAVTASPHYISSSPLGQSLVFLADFLEVHASSVAPRLGLGVSVVSDRGYLSKYAYQEVVLSRALGAAPTRRLLDEIFAHLPSPALTIHLTAPESCLYERLLSRDGHCAPARLDFIARAAAAAVAHLARNTELRAVTIDTSQRLDDVLREVTGVVRRRL
jgi:thymidylate kinase